MRVLRFETEIGADAVAILSRKSDHSRIEITIDRGKENVYSIYY